MRLKNLKEKISSQEEGQEKPDECLEEKLGKRFSSLSKLSKNRGFPFKFSSKIKLKRNEKIACS